MSLFRHKAAALIALLPLSAAADEAPAIPPLVSGCVSCHSADGNPLVAGVPIIAGQRADYLVSALKSYRSGSRSGGPADVMRHFSEELSDKDIEEIAAWFSTN
ncbi:Cytochrome c553 [Paracoccus isoporae]|uniref:Cytochrome c553 n=1 Tax=Paracoccus isoporae TaxID=591205 RepID=A0A1G7F7Y9_9RHOB|nr:c-type cytochrome [Paracoccus isoporae]SDE71954.1 Cytochrome c553 [Paracoccus isoporae]